MLRPLVNLSGVRRKLIQIVTDRARDLFPCSPGLLHGLGLILALAAGIGGNGAAINRRRLATDKTEGCATIGNHLEHPAQDVAIREPTVPVLGTGRPVRHAAFEAETTKPAIRQIEVALVNQPPFRTDAIKVADQQYADHQLRIDRRPTGVAVEGIELVADRAEV